MNLTFLKIIVRKVLTYRLNALIKLLCLVTGMTTFLLISSWVISENSYDSFWPDKELIYRVSLKKYDNAKLIYQSAKNFFGAARVLKNEVAGIEASTNIRKDIATIYTSEHSVQDIRMFYADSTFFKVFPLSLKTNNPDNPFPDFRGAIISKSLAGKLYGVASPLNQKFKLNEGWEFYVCGVFDDLPGKSHLDIDVLIYSRSLDYYLKYFNNSTGKVDSVVNLSVTDIDPYNRSTWQYPDAYTYIKIDKNADPVTVERKSAGVLKERTRHLAVMGERAEFIFQSVQSIHMAPNLEGELPGKGSRFKVITLSIISILVLFISWFNYVNLSIAESLKGIVSQGIRRAMGARETDLFLENLAETFVFHLSAGLISIILVSVIFRNGLSVTGLEIPQVSFRILLLFSFMTALAGALISAIIPFLMLLRIRSYILLKERKSVHFHRQFAWNGMLGFQFMVAIFLIISTITVFRQVSLLQNKVLGFDINQVLVSYSPMTMNLRPDKKQKLETFQNEVLQIPSVISFTTTAAIPGRDPARYSENVHLQEQINNKGQFTLLNVGEDYFDFFSIRKLYGKVFTKGNKYDTDEIIINSKACSSLGIDNPMEAIDKVILINEMPYRLIGIVDDFHQKSLREEIAPTIFFKSLKWNYEVGFYCIRVSPDNMATTVKQLGEIWNKVYPKEPYIYSFLNDDYYALYDSEVAFGRVFTVFTLLSVFMLTIGLFASVKLSSELTVREIGIRKVFGANIIEVLAFLNTGYLKMVIYSFLIAIPFAWVAMQKWLLHFAFRTDLSWYIFALAGILTLIIAMLTAGWQSWKAATRNPVEVLRNE
jgi:putative ABC transport system permease protein